jgi:uncharacterized surface protein with fasciclin (FAS1) repeats
MQLDCKCSVREHAVAEKEAKRFQPSWFLLTWRLVQVAQRAQTKAYRAKATEDMHQSIFILVLVIAAATAFVLPSSPLHRDVAVHGSRSGRDERGRSGASSSFLPDVVDTAVEAGSFSTLVSALTAADLASVLKSDGPFTVFAPDDRAFSKLPSGTVEGLLADVPKLKDLLSNHVVCGHNSIGSMETAGKDFVTMTGRRITVKVSGEGAIVSNVPVIARDLKCNNGVIHVIDEVLM